MKAIKDVTGVTPNTFRPPYGDLDDRVRAVAAAMGLRPIQWYLTTPIAMLINLLLLLIIFVIGPVLVKMSSIPKASRSTRFFM